MSARGHLRTFRALALDVRYPMRSGRLTKRSNGVEPMAHAVGTHNVLADDVPADSLSPDQALANAPARDGDFFKVPKVIGDS